MRYSVPHHKRVWPGVLLALVAASTIAVAVTWRSNKLVAAALGAVPPAVEKSNGPSSNDRDVLDLIIKKSEGSNE